MSAKVHQINPGSNKTWMSVGQIWVSTFGSGYRCSEYKGFKLDHVVGHLASKGHSGPLVFRWVLCEALSDISTLYI